MYFQPAYDIIRRLEDHGCLNVTDRLVNTSYGEYPHSTGGFGDVYRGMLHDSTEVAIKTLRLAPSPPSDVQKSLKRAARELHVWSKCQHPNVLPLIGLVVFRDQIAMVSRWMGLGDLRSYIRQTPNEDRFRMSADISAGLAYLHENGIVRNLTKILLRNFSNDRRYRCMEI
ncbi:hypothetical protein FRC09_020797 [Ceratobasidium sp. 395]|nr:hypothetical protein FRC09_020797 [Ceratobasidium sp. 395]